jgi:hypothetical protein
MAACSMSCSHEEDASVVSSGVYVLPEPVGISASAESVNSLAELKHEEVLQVFAPPSPPPKASLL